jgi:hypothetical protein
MPYQDTTRDKPSHTSGTPRGEALGKPVDRMEDDATGINVETRKPIDSRMPHFPPA